MLDQGSGVSELRNKQPIVIRSPVLLNKDPGSSRTELNGITALAAAPHNPPPLYMMP